MEWVFQRARAAWQDSANTVLLVLAASALCFVLVVPLLAAQVPADWRRPGGAPLHVLGICGGLLFVLSAGFSAAKRAKATSRVSPRIWFALHVWCAWAGILLAALHTAGRYLSPPALILGLALGLMCLGVWARVGLSARIAATFASKRRSFDRRCPVSKDRLRDLMDRKVALLSVIDPGADEALWSPGPRDWLRHPILTARYARLAAREKGITGGRRVIPLAQGYWRALHILASWLLLLALAAHVLVATLLPDLAVRGWEISLWPGNPWAGR